MSNETKKFKVGDRVRAKVQGFHAKLGDVGTIGENSWVQWDNPGGCSPQSGCAISYDDLEFYAKTLDSLAVDDVVVSDEGGEYTVLDVHGKVVDIADSDGHFAYSLTVKEMKDDDWTVKGAEPELTEVTLEEVAKLKGVPVEKLRIKE